MMGGVKTRTNTQSNLQNGALLVQNKFATELQQAVDNPGQAGQSLSQYENVRQIGQGSSGEVYLVRRKSDDTYWVSKQVKLSQMQASSMLMIQIRMHQANH
eukprot:760704-Hanusia_phi.AAC.5